MTESQGKNQKIDISRRGFTRIGISAPVLMTLVSRPVLGANCMSEMMSGNLSQHGHDSCSAGYSPTAWAGALPDGYSDVEIGNTELRNLWSGAPEATIAQLLVSDASIQGVPVKNAIAALLNIGTTGYAIPNEAALYDLLAGTIKPPGSLTANEFLVSTW
ncbi:MAG: hypothetical protein V7709_16670 [Halioglobus sp.]